MTTPASATGATATTETKATDEWSLERLLHSRATYAIALLVAVLLFAFGDGDRRENAADFVQRDLKDPVAATSPFSVVDMFMDEARGCSFNSFSCEPKSLWAMLPQFPAAFIHTAGHVLEQGPAAWVVIVLPFLILALGFGSSIFGDDGPPVVILHPGFWLAFLLMVAAFGWVIQLVLLFVLLVVKQTILACGVLALLYVIYERFELGTKILNLVMGVMGKRVAPAL